MQQTSTTKETAGNARRRTSRGQLDQTLAPILLPWPLTPRKLSDLFVTAIESGFCNYWLREARLLRAGAAAGGVAESAPALPYSRASSYLYGGWRLHVTLHEPYPGNRTRYNIGQGEVVRGLIWRPREAIELLDPESTQFDGPAADAILQQAVFGKQVFG